MLRTNHQADVELNLMRETGASAWTPYVGLITAVSDIGAGSVTEASYQGYARQEADFAAPGALDGETSGRQVETDAVIEFPAKEDAGTATITHIGIWDASTSGNLRYVHELGSSKGITQGDPAEIATGDLIVGAQ